MQNSKNISGRINLADEIVIANEDGSIGPVVIVTTLRRAAEMAGPWQGDFSHWKSLCDPEPIRGVRARLCFVRSSRDPSPFWKTPAKF